MTISLIPESAPFTDEQRAWLNGFLAGWTGLAGADGSMLAGHEMATAISAANGTMGSVAPAGEEVFPWHDPSIELDERMKLAEGKPLERRMMAAMAQLNCGACGYACKTYSEAIASGEEKNLTLCSPGGKDTAKMLKLLKKELEAGTTTSNVASTHGQQLNGHSTNGVAKPIGYSRANPYTARVKSSENLNAVGSSKHTSHVVIDLGDSGITYNVGDSLGVYPTNCDVLVEEVLKCIDSVSDELGQRLKKRLCLRSITDELLETLQQKTTDVDTQAAIAQLVDSDELDTMDVLDLLRRFPVVRLSGEELAGCLREMTPRLYSIASSQRAHPGEVHLTVGKATTTIGGRTYKGVASTMFADRVGADHPVRVFVHPSHGFTIPADPKAPMIMVGPGTGIAPFRAFLEERAVTGASGRNWLIFGDQHEATDFLYRDELESLAARGQLAKLSVAFSRDQEEKIYVQDRMREAGEELFAWLEAGGYFFVCGDAKRMAADVDRALHDVVATHGAMSQEAAKEYVQALRAAGRYVRDVY